MAQNRGPADWNGLLLHVVVRRKYSRLTMLPADISRHSSLAAKKEGLLSASSGMILNKHYEVGARNRNGQNRPSGLRAKPSFNIDPECLTRDSSHCRSC